MKFDLPIVAHNEYKDTTYYGKININYESRVMFPIFRDAKCQANFTFISVVN